MIDHATVSYLLRRESVDGLMPSFDEISRRIAPETAARQDERGVPYISNPHRLHLVGGMIVATKARRVLEIGAGRGYCTIGMVLVSRQEGREIQVVTADTIAHRNTQAWGIITSDGQWRVERRSLQQALERFGCAGQVTVVHGFSCRELPHVGPERGFEVIFIDGCHSFWNVAYDLLRSVQLMAPGGRIVMDDFGGSQGIGTVRVVRLLSSLGWLDATVLDMEHPSSAPEVERNHRMAAVRPTPALLSRLASPIGRPIVGLVRGLARAELLLNGLKQRVARLIRG